MLNPRLSGLPDYPFDRLRTLLEPISPAPGLSPLSLAVGEPQHEPPNAIATALADNSHLWGRYPPSDGTPEFRSAVAGWLRRRYGLDDAEMDADRHVLAASGTREALYLISALVVPEVKAGGRPHVAMPNPLYHVYGGAAAVSGAERMLAPATAENGFLPDFSTIDGGALARTALFYFCSPANPQGAVASLSYLKEAIQLAREHDFVLVVDECYAEIYDQDPPPGALQACKDLGGGYENVLVFHSLSKRSSAPGLRSGFVAGDENLISHFRRLRSYIGPQMPMPAMAASVALWNDEIHVEENRRLYREKLDIAEELLAGRYGFYRPAGGFFLWLDVGDSEAAAEALWRDAALRVLPGAYISLPGPTGANPGHDFIRVALVHDPATTQEALERLVGVLG